MPISGGTPQILFFWYIQYSQTGLLLVVAQLVIMGITFYWEHWQIQLVLVENYGHLKIPRITR